jgi:hypothetical protein
MAIAGLVLDNNIVLTCNAMILNIFTTTANDVSWSSY